MSLSILREPDIPQWAQRTLLRLEGDLNGEFGAIVQGHGVHVIDYVPASLQPAVKAGTNTADLTPYIQAAHDYVALTLGRGTLYFDGYKYVCNTSKLTFDLARVAIEGGGCLLDFSGLASSDPATAPNLVTSPRTGWIDGTLGGGTRVNWDLATAGKAKHTSTAAAEYGDFGQQCSFIQAGKRYKITWTADSITTSGASTYVSINVGDGVGSPPGNGIGYGSQVTQTQSVAGTYSFTLTAPTTVTAGGAWLAFKTNNTAQIDLDSLVVQLIPDNTAILLRTASNSPIYGGAAFTWQGVELKGPGSSHWLDGIVCDTLVTSRSTRLAGFGSSVHDFKNGLSFVNDTYCLKVFAFDIYACASCVTGQANTVNSGEMLAFYGCTLFNSAVGLTALGGFEWQFFGGSFDYCSQHAVIQGTARASFHGVHFETRAATTATQYPFDISGGVDLIFSGGCEFLMNGLTGASTYWFNTASKFDRVFLQNCSAYGLHTASGELMGGGGRLFINGLCGIPNHGMGYVTVRDDRHDVFAGNGDFEGSSIQVLAWVTGGQGQLCSSTAGALHQYNGGAATGNGTISLLYAPAPCAPGLWQIVMTAATTFNVLRPNGSLDGTGTTGTTYFGNISFLITVGGSAFVANDTIPVTVGSDARHGVYWRSANGTGAYTGSALLSLDTTYHQAGSKSLRFLKLGAGSGGGQQSNFYLAAPIAPGRMAGMEMYYRCPLALGGAGTQLLYAYAYFAQILGVDPNGVPILGDSVFIGGQNISVDQVTGQSAFTLAAYTSLYSDLTSATDGYTPEWATHLLLSFNPAAQPAGFQVNIDGLAGWAW